MEWLLDSSSELLEIKMHQVRVDKSQDKTSAVNVELAPDCRDRTEGVLPSLAPGPGGLRL